MSCRPAVMPNTRLYIVRRLDSQEQEVTLLKKATGGECLDKVCKTLGILEKDYFGLRYVDKNGEYLWINLRNPLHEQLVPGNRPVMEMRVKYFVKPQKLLQPVTRYHFYKQLKRDLLHGKLKVGTSVKAARLTALMAQIEKGDYRVGFQYQHKVMCQATESDNMDARIRREHQKIAGTSVEMATEKFLEEVSMLELYGVELYHVLNNHRVPQVIGVGPENVQVYSRSMELQKRFSYSSVQYTAFHAKKFTALVASSSNNSGSRQEQMDFELKSRAASQALYRTITEFHTFFRRESVSSVVKTAGFCKSLLGNFKGQNPDRFYFDVMKTHREVVDHVWSILHPSTTLMHDSDSATTHSQLNSSPANSTPTTPSSTRRNHMSDNSASPSRSSSSSSIRSHSHHHHNHHHRDHSSSGSRRGSQQSMTSPAPSSSSADNDIPPPLPPPARHMQRASNMHRSHSVQESDIRHAILQRMPPLPPYSQRSCSSDALMRASTGRRSQRSMPNHGPHMASTATFNPYMSPSISETESDLDESMYASGGSDCYVAMSTQSEPTYFPSTTSDASGSSITTALSDATSSSHHHHHHLHVAQVHPARPGSDTSGVPSDTYITSGDSECSNGSFRAHSPPPLYTEVDPENTVSINFNEGSSLPNSGSLSLVSPIIPVPAGSGSNSTVFNFDAAAVLTRTRELEGELQRLRSAMTCRLCKQNPIGATFCPCGHTVCCYQCAQRLRTCWECDQSVHSVQRMLLAR